MCDVAPAGDTSIPAVEDDQTADEVGGVLEDYPLLFARKRRALEGRDLALALRSKAGRVLPSCNELEPRQPLEHRRSRFSERHARICLLELMAQPADDVSPSLVAVEVGSRCCRPYGFEAVGEHGITASLDLLP